MSMPVRYSPAVETIEADEAETNAALIEQLLKISSTTYADGEGALRSVHAKSHGVLKGAFEVAAGLPPELAQGLFALPGRYDVALRFSTSPGDLLPDRVSTPRGLALKLFGVPGARLAGSEGDTTQDFLLVTGKAFIAKTGKQFLGNLKLLAPTTDKMESAKIALSVALRATENVIEALGGESATIKTLGGYPETHILGESFFSQVPIRYGDFVAKVGVVPASPELTALAGKAFDLNHDDDALRALVREHFATKGGAWDFRVQLCTDLTTMPVEDPTKPWDEAQSPYVTVARLVVPPQDSWSAPLRGSIDTALSFNPWHALAAHQPLGSIMRARRATYPASARFRLEKSGCPFSEPQGL